MSSSSEFSEMVSPISRCPVKLEYVSSDGLSNGLRRRTGVPNGLVGLGFAKIGAELEESTIGDECARIIGRAERELADERVRRWLLE